MPSDTIIGLVNYLGAYAQEKYINEKDRYYATT